jgi:hypothetical protein
MKWRKGNREVARMIDIQTISVTIASAGVFLAAIYYIFQLRYIMKAREMEICRLNTSDYASEQGMQRYATVMSMEWKDYEDFIEKYYYSRPEMFGKWTSQLLTWETLGTLVKNKVVKAERLYDLGAYGAIVGWEKFKDIIQRRRDDAWGQDYMSNAEFFAQEMLRIKTQRDASFKDKLKKTSNTSNELKEKEQTGDKNG